MHQVTTDDGYILELHRIPYGKGQSSDPSIKRRAVFVQHGFLNTDNVWLINPTNQALGTELLYNQQLLFSLIYISFKWRLYFGWQGFWCLAWKCPRQHLFTQTHDSRSHQRSLLEFLVKIYSSSEFEKTPTVTNIMQSIRLELMKWGNMTSLQ